ncbi:hypothetical protein [Nonlabens tegetincola]|uniref:hypothetical protein n=1 Tax=Nonlabens tegetincola TaxID=323273 RepID=UPI000CF42909|nr:hypothetical protein [Nonlabens tegetincola]PQJ13940.1 hypothetical protein BST93_11790 [Nonlabens tegetincola]
MTKKQIIIVLVCGIFLVIAGYRIFSALDLVNDNKNVDQPEINKSFFYKDSENIKHVRSQRNRNSSIYSIYNINNFDYGLIISSYDIDSDIMLDSIISRVNKDPYDRFNYGQGSIFKTDFFYNYHPDNFINKIEIRSVNFEKAEIEYKKPNVFNLKTPVLDEIGLSLNNGKESFVLVENKSFSKTYSLEICIVKKYNKVYLFILKAINKNTEARGQINLSQIINIESIAK